MKEVFVGILVLSASALIVISGIVLLVLNIMGISHDMATVAHSAALVLCWVALIAASLLNEK